ncbi:mannitol dehydrogenase C-terminal domain-containing protein [Lentinula aciculospora]|uniref:Mannitol-1-phosphate 5-dehydrogenase n=1 Tax=Lentinula aciculospora TaxID=153920 RepID=A0A9W8ZZI2_9AGAR|nr:mannitol dehydrogenase C-terminal domain-containing protein [Lentinula aciculospora]
MPFEAVSLPGKPTAIQFGAGNIGRGFIGAVLSQAGFHVVFADVQEKIVQSLNENGHYDVHILNGETQIETIGPVSAVMSTDLVAIENIAREPLSIITTAVGPNILPRLAKPIAQIIRTRMEEGMGPINIVACENLQNATDKLREAIENELSDEKERLYMQDNIGFAICSVDRIVPPFSSENILDVGVEPFFEWTVDSNSLKKTDPDVVIDGMHATNNLDAYVQRKLFTLNTGHAITAYLGFLKKKATILDAISDGSIRDTVSQALHESGTALIAKHHPFFSHEEHEEYINKTLKRFSNHNLRDEVSRVGREPLRKLRKGDRLLGPVEMCRERNLEHDTLLLGVAAALLFYPTGIHEDKEANEIHDRIQQEGIEEVVSDLTGWSKDDVDSQKIIQEYSRLKSEY